MIVLDREESGGCSHHGASACRRTEQDEEDGQEQLMNQLKTLIIGTVLSTGLVMAAIARTPDGETPAEEAVCDEVSRSLFGLCGSRTVIQYNHVLRSRRNGRTDQRTAVEFALRPPVVHQRTSLRLESLGLEGLEGYSSGIERR